MIVILFLFLAVLAFALKYLPYLNYEKREPPILPQTIPYLSHLLGILWNGSTYYAKVRANFKLPIYTLPVLNGRVYAVNDVALISIIQRKTKTFSFDPFVILAAKRLAGVSDEGMKIIEGGINAKNNEQRKGMVIPDTHARFHAMLTPGPNFDDMNQRMAENISTLLDVDVASDSNTVELFKWTRHLVSIASTNATYGPLNPFADPSMEEAFWEYEHNLARLLIGIKPEYMAAKTYRGRETVANNFAEYLRRGGWRQASALVKASFEANTRHGISLEDQARFEITTCIGLLVNTVPAVFWTIAHIFSDPILLENIRQEVASSLDIREVDGSSMVEMNLRKLKDNSPLLTSTFKEVLRLRSFTLSARMVMEDAVLDDKCVLKKGGIVQIPSPLIHKDPKIWGSNAEEFAPRRFMSGDNVNTQRKKIGVAFRAFGGGAATCPGRHFATMEAISIVASIATRFDLEPLDGAWVLPAQTSNNMTTSVLPPDNDIRIRMRIRKEFAGMSWAFPQRDAERI